MFAVALANLTAIWRVIFTVLFAATQEMFCRNAQSSPSSQATHRFQPIHVQGSRRVDAAWREIAQSRLTSDGSSRFCLVICPQAFEKFLCTAEPLHPQLASRLSWSVQSA